MVDLIAIGGRKHMTKQEIVDMFALRMDGVSLQEIGDRYGVTKEYVRQLIGAPHGIDCRVQVKSIYKGLWNWMVSNKISAHRLSNMLSCAENYTSFSRKITGKSALNIREIKDILSVTGMTFEEAFGEEE